MMHAAFLLLALATPRSSPDPYQIYKKALQRLATLPQPRYIIDTQRQLITTLRNGEARDQTDHVARYVYDSETREECGFFLPFNRTDEPSIGPSYFGPDVWLIRHGNAPPAKNGSNMSPDLSDLRTISSVVAVAKPSYEITLIGIDRLKDGGSAYHLALRPLSDPVKHNLRALWIDASTYDIVRAVIFGQYRLLNDSVIEPTEVTEDFGNVGGYWLVLHKIWTWAKPFSSITYRLDFTSLSMQFPSTVPMWLFDYKSFKGHTFNTNDPLFQQ